jgi:hypothetical protein
VIRGGLRTRFIVDSTRIAVIAALSELGWFEGTVHDSPPGPRRHWPLRYVPKPLKWDDQVEPNAIAISTDDTHSIRRGLGGEVEDSMRIYVDLFVESDELGWHLAQDVRDLLIGKMANIGRDAPAIDIYDLRLATPAAFTQVDVERPFIDRAESESREWRNRWFMVRFELIDEYHDEYGEVDVDPAQWTDEFAPVWHQIQRIELGS